MKPMLAAKVDESKLNFPYLASPKLDGVRCIIKDGVVLSRTLKPIPNKYVQKVLGKLEYDGLDGELIVGDVTDPNVIQNTVSGVMSVEGYPDFMYYVFDKWNKIGPYEQRMAPVHKMTEHGHYRMSVVLNLIIEDMEELAKYEGHVLHHGYEGVMLRKPEALYKFGRSTMKQGNLLKLKRFSDAEATIIGFVEERHNGNEATIDELGNMKRSTHQANKHGKGTLGALVVKDSLTGIEFNVGSGFTAEQRQDFWKYKNDILGKLITYKYFSVGQKDAPRFPTFVCFREDM